MFFRSVAQKTGGTKNATHSNVEKSRRKNAMPIGGMPSGYLNAPRKRYTGNVNPITGMTGQGGGAAQGGAIGGGANLPTSGTAGIMGGVMGRPMDLGTGRPAGGTGGVMGAGGPGGMMTPGAPAPTPAPPSMPAPGPQMPYKPGAPGARDITSTMSGYGKGMLDPNSEYSKRMQEVLTGRIGEETEASKRLAAFQASQAGMGGGGSPELMAMLGDIDIAGMEAGGQASAEMMGQMPGMGLDFLGGALQGELGISGQDLQAWMGQQQLQQQAQGMGTESFYRGQELDLERERMNQKAMMDQLAMMFG